MSWNSFVIKELSVVSSWLFFCLWWIIDLTLERCFNITPTIRNATSVEILDTIHTTKKVSNCNEEVDVPTTTDLPMFKIMTKSIDENKNFRTQKKASLYYTKSVMCFIGFCICLVMIFEKPDWVIDHFLYFNYKTQWNYEIYHYMLSLTLSFYGFEIVVVRKYSELNWSQFIHHWITIILCAAILIGIFMPFVTCFLFFGVYCVFPVDFILGFRIHLCSKYPNFTQISCKICAIYYGMLCIINSVIILLLVINGFVKYKSYPVPLTVFLVVVCWPLVVWDDWSFFKSLRSYGRMDYKNVDLKTASQSVIKI
eukprot:474323_1